MAKVEYVNMPPRHDQPGYYALADLPQRQSISQICKSTGWWELDEIFKLYPGQFVMVTGTSSHGKSTFLLNMVCNMFVQKVRTFLYVPENEEHVREKLSWIWGDRPGWEAFANIGCFVQSAAVETYNAEPKTLQWVLAQAIIAIQQDGVGLVIIDPWNELERAKPKDMLLTEYIAQCLMWLKRFARMYGVTVILVAHPTKAGIAEGRVPTLADIENSLAWFNKCDNGLIVAREGNTTTTKVISAKVRELGAGKRGTCYFTVDPDTGVFTPQPGAVSVGNGGAESDEDDGKWSHYRKGGR